MANENPDGEGEGEQAETGSTVVETQQDPRLTVLSAQLAALSDDKRTFNGIIYTPKEIIAAILDRDAFLSELDLLKNPTASKISPEGQLVVLSLDEAPVGDRSTYGEGEDEAKRLVYRRASGDVAVATKGVMQFGNEISVYVYVPADDAFLQPTPLTIRNLPNFSDLSDAREHTDLFTEGTRVLTLSPGNLESAVWAGGKWHAKSHSGTDHPRATARIWALKVTLNLGQAIQSQTPKQELADIQSSSEVSALVIAIMSEPRPAGEDTSDSGFRGVF